MADVDRRTFVNTVTGYALAVSPVTAWAITTPSNDLETADVTIPTGKETMPGYAAWPKKGGTRGAVLVIQEIFGVHEYIKDVCRRLANEGYFAIAPSLYFRHGDATQIADIDKLRKDIVDKVGQAQVMTDLDAAVAWLGKQKNVDAANVAITGFCWGGNVVWMYAGHNPKLKAGVAWYGRLKPDTSPLMPKTPVDIGAGLTVPVLGLYGGKDKGIPQDTVELMRKELAKGKTDSKIIVYPDAEHGFHADYRPSYNASAANEGWGEMLKWFKAKGLASSK